MVQIWQQQHSWDWAGCDCVYPGLGRPPNTPGVPALAGQATEGQLGVSGHQHVQLACFSMHVTDTHSVHVMSVGLLTPGKGVPVECMVENESKRSCPLALIQYKAPT